MYSDDWLKNGYSHGERVWLGKNKVVNYYVWYDHMKMPVGVSVNFEYADDVHYDVTYSDWTLFLEKDLRDNSFEHTKALDDFFKNINYNCFTFEEFLNECNIKYSKATYY